MKPLKDLAELNHPRVDPKILLQFNTLIENVRIYASNHAPSWGTHEILKCFEFMDKLELITPEPELKEPIFAKWCSEDIRMAIQEGQISEDEVIAYFKIPSRSNGELVEKYPKHNHITRDMKPPGECPSCDLYYKNHKKIMGKPSKYISVNYGEIEQRVMAGLTPEEKDSIHKFIDFSNGAHGTDGSGDCEETKEAFNPKKWLK